MKRFLCFFLSVLLLLPLFLLPVSAAESQEFVFYCLEPEMTLEEDYDFTGDPQYSTFASSSLLVDGYYYAVLFLGKDSAGNDLVFTSAPFYFSWSLNNKYQYSPYILYSASFTSPLLFEKISYRMPDESFSRSVNDIYLNFSLSYTDYVDSSKVDSFVQRLTIRSFKTTGLYLADPTFTVKLVSCPSPAVMNLTGSISENPNAIFKHILSILPVVIPVIVSFIGIRKGIFWVKSKLSGA